MTALLILALLYAVALFPLQVILGNTIEELFTDPEFDPGLHYIGGVGRWIIIIGIVAFSFTLLELYYLGRWTCGEDNHKNRTGLVTALNLMMISDAIQAVLALIAQNQVFSDMEARYVVQILFNAGV